VSCWRERRAAGVLRTGGRSGAGQGRVKSDDDFSWLLRTQPPAGRKAKSPNRVRREMQERCSARCWLVCAAHKPTHAFAGPSVYHYQSPARRETRSITRRQPAGRRCCHDPTSKVLAVGLSGCWDALFARADSALLPRARALCFPASDRCCAALLVDQLGPAVRSFFGIRLSLRSLAAS